ncbi:16S rRNA (cytosine(967)-C(5))-methyltransferase RsmB [Conexibacter sp. W3-3-2]|uniref:16S rRNA (cytosine(967)-C(5))-methyltransferase RsmB n=1 Tax=Conexibacter sp. W3-3-2 TaxID=2675227 RepID=UPI0012BA1C36|nr:16S rRNA (cytosine(967)-C(5))-methyltransferase RsmB [Conexibacter sp. W3-3-2]MTD43503.1 16S rRNA (cytosine(967)-C(5))-methyltransferase RsmB [Conexibacter sp. W3-3-2]
MSAVSPARATALRVVRRVFEQGAYADRALRAEAEGLDPRERALAKRLVFGVVQRHGTLEWIVSRHAKGRLQPEVRAALWLGLEQLLFLDGIADHAAISESVELAKPGPGHKVVNAILRRVQREGIELPADTDPQGAAIRHSHPEWLVRRWWDELGADETRALLAANNEPAELVLRINTLVPVDASQLPPGRREDDALVLDGPFDLAGSPLFAAGAITPQSRAAQRVARFLGPRPGERVLDLCAAPGGKTAHLAALMGGEGDLVAVEQHTGRAGVLQRTCERLHARNVTVVVADASRFQTDRPFDRVLLDPPCSGLGTLRSHPDLRWRVTEAAITQLAALQDRMLQAARGALKPGGTLVYSTCTISREEERLVGDERFQTLPHRDGTDGFYVARETP